MSNSHNLIESLARDRHAERYGAARRAPLAAAARRTAARRTAARDRIGAARKRAGWLLVDLGLRLLAGRGDAPAPGAGLIGQ